VSGGGHCRFQIFSGNNIIQTLPQIRDICQKTEILRNSSHHDVRNIIANVFRQKKLFKVFEKFYCLSVEDNNTENHRADIIAIEINIDHSLILDQKICWETYDPQQDSAANEEKKSIRELYVSTAILYHKLGNTWILV